MKINTFLKEILTREVPMDNEEKDDLKRDIDIEYNKTSFSQAYIDELKTSGKPIPLKVKMKQLSENTYFRVVLAICYLGAIRWIRELKNPRPEHSEDEEIY